MDNRRNPLRGILRMMAIGLLCGGIAGLGGGPAEAVQAENRGGSAEAVQAENREKENQTAADEEIDQIISSLSLEEKAAQLFVVLPEQLTGVPQVTAAGKLTREAFETLPVGGLVYMEQNLESADQVKEMLSGVQAISRERVGLPLFLCVDEEGGSVARVNSRGIVDAPYIGDMASVGVFGEPREAGRIGEEMGTYLRELGFTTDFAPVADVLSNPYNTVVRERSFGSDPELVAGMVSAEVSGLQEKGVMAVLKHFPGHGATGEDSHEGLAVSYRTMEELQEGDLVPFRAGIAAGARCVMAGHIMTPLATTDGLPATLSSQMLTGLLRDTMGFDGLIITDALNMGAIAQSYDSAQAAVMALMAGADLLLMPQDLSAAYQGVLNAVASGIIPEERLDESMRRIIREKLRFCDAG